MTTLNVPVNDDTGEKPIEYRIDIKPDPKNGSRTAEIHFVDKDTKEKYVYAEFKFCKHQYQVYAGSMDLDSRATAFEKLSAMRTLFAQQQGYGPVKGNENHWEFQGIPEKENDIA